MIYIEIWLLSGFLGVLYFRFVVSKQKESMYMLLFGILIGPLFFGISVAHFIVEILTPKIVDFLHIEI